MQAEDLQEKTTRLHAAEIELAVNLGDGPPSHSQILIASDEYYWQEIIETAASLGLGTEHTFDNLETVVYEELIDLLRLADYAGLDFRDAVRSSLWAYGCDLLDDGSRIVTPQDLRSQAKTLTAALAGTPIRPEHAEILGLLDRLEHAEVLELTDRERGILTAVRELGRSRRQQGQLQ
jgi:hypothetical protein